MTAQWIVPADRVRSNGKQRMAHVAHEHVTAREFGGVLRLERVGQIQPVQRLVGIVGDEPDIPVAFDVGEAQCGVSSQSPRPEPAAGQRFFKQYRFGSHDILFSVFVLVLLLVLDLSAFDYENDDEEEIVFLRGLCCSGLRVFIVFTFICRLLGGRQASRQIR
jgi:hypothetical protein